jgi:hypothetical protein
MGERGQSTVEWTALVLLVSLALSILAAIVGIGLPGAALADAIASRMICAVGLSECTGKESLLAAAYGSELASMVGELAPEVRYEDGMRALPVDYRRCREDACADGAEEGDVARSLTGERTTAFLRVIDCRAGSPTFTAEANCAPPARGNIYLQYWFYYPGSATGEGSIAPGPIREVTTALGAPSYHPDDWEGYQVRIGPAGTFARASSHHGYGSGWEPARGGFHVAGGSHAGAIAPRDYDRITRPAGLRLVPLEEVARREDASFAVTPPWRKRVWTDPEYEGTD